MPVKCVPIIYVLSKNKKNSKKKKKKKKKSTENFHFYNFKNLCILHGRVFVMKIIQILPEASVVWRTDDSVVCTLAFDDDFSFHRLQMHI